LFTTIAFSFFFKSPFQSRAARKIPSNGDEMQLFKHAAANICNFLYFLDSRPKTLPHSCFSRQPKEIELQTQSGFNSYLVTPSKISLD